MKKMIATLLFLSLFILQACGGEQVRTITAERTFDFTSFAEEYTLDDDVLTLFYFTESGIPYVDVESFLRLLDGGRATGALDMDRLVITYEDDRIMIESEPEPNEDALEDDPLDDEPLTLTMDFNENKATVSRYGFFSSFQQATQTDFGAGLEVVDFIYDLKDPVTFDFGAYQFELHRHDAYYLMPFHIANLFFSGSMFDVYYNGDRLIGVDTYQLTRIDETLAMELLVSPYNNTTMSSELKDSVYHYLAFSFDYFYGLKNDQNVSTYYDVLSRSMTRGSDAAHYGAILDFTLGLDDLHTAFLMTGMYAIDYAPNITWNDLGPRTRNFYETPSQLPENYCVNDAVIYYDNDTVASIPLKGFDADTPETFKAALDLIDAKGTVNDIIIDLSCNTGGIVGVMLQTLGFITDETIPMHRMNSGDLSTATTFVASETVARDYNWHFKVSPRTFSAGNMMAQIAIEMELGTVFGQDTHGGAASIKTNITPSGAILIMSSPSLMTDAHYESLEMGINITDKLPLEDYDNEAAILDIIR